MREYWNYNASAHRIRLSAMGVVGGFPLRGRRGFPPKGS